MWMLASSAFLSGCFVTNNTWLLVCIVTKQADNIDHLVTLVLWL